MIKLYDDLYIGIPSGIRIEGCIVGRKWTTVRANGNIGLARTLEPAENPEQFASSFIGAYLRDTANHMKWENLSLASVGVAAMNAWYNTKERVDGLGGEIGSIQEMCKKAAYVGNYSGENVFPLPTSPDFNTTAYEKLNSFDTVVITSEALTSMALPKLFSNVSEHCHLILDGYSLPCSALFFAFGMPVRELRGFIPKFPETLEACAKGDRDDPSPGLTPFTIRSV